jgi:hypothetical protein
VVHGAVNEWGNEYRIAAAGRRRVLIERPGLDWTEDGARDPSIRRGGSG